MLAFSRHEIVDHRSLRQVMLDCQIVAHQSRLQSRIVVIAEAALVGVYPSIFDHVIETADEFRARGNPQQLNITAIKVILDQIQVKVAEEIVSERARTTSMHPVALM